MAGATEKAIIQDAKETALKEFEAGVRRSIKHADEGFSQDF